MEFLNYWKRLLEYLDPYSWLIRLWELLQDAFYWVLQALLDLCASILSTITLPAMSLPTPEGSVPYTILAAINWVIPIGFAIKCAEVMVFSTVLYFTVGVILRWLKVAA